MTDEDWEDNPFENRPGDKRIVEKKPSARSQAPPPPPEVDEDNPFERGSESGDSDLLDDEINPFENMPSSDAYGYGADDDYLDIDEFDKSKLALVSGMGFVGLGAIMVLFVIVPGNLLLMGLSFASIIISSMVAFFYLLDDLRIRPHSLTERSARFISGILFMVLVILLFIPLITHWPNTQDIDLTIPLTLLPIIVLTHASVALFLYSMLWEE